MSASVVRAFFDAMQARDWEAARALVAADAVVTFPVTGERFVGRRWVDMNEAYPEGWSIEVAELLGDAARVAARVAVTHAGEVFWCAGFYTVAEGRIAEAIELWSTERSETPPEWRRPFWA